MDIQDSIEKLNFEANQQISLKGSDFSHFFKKKSRVRRIAVRKC